MIPALLALGGLCKSFQSIPDHPTIPPPVLLGALAFFFLFPGTSTESSGYGAPSYGTSYEAPAESYSAPASGYDAPSSGYDEPSHGHSYSYRRRREVDMPHEARLLYGDNVAPFLNQQASVDIQEIRIFPQPYKFLEAWAPLRLLR